MSTRGGTFFRRIDIRFPWLKLVVVCLIGLLAILDLLDLTISSTTSPSIRARLAPMSRHVRIRRDYSDKKLVALTFDDGPSADTTPRLLDILFEKDVRATFFMLGDRARNNPDIVRRIAKEHNTVASHTMRHQNLVKLSSAAVEADINESKSVFNSILGHAPELIRPPYGNVNDLVRSKVGTPIILWSVDPADWQNQDPETILSTIKAQIHDGAIILMHDIYQSSVDAVPIIIDSLRADGYEFVTVPELAKARRINLAPGITYYNFRP